MTEGRGRIAIVLGAAVRSDGTASPTLDLRIRHAVALWHAGRLDRLCLTGGSVDHRPPEAVVTRDLARALGIPADVLLIEIRSTNTHENIANALQLLPPDTAITLVSNRWHLPRAWLIARLMGHRVALSGPRGSLSVPRTALAFLRELAATPLSIARALRDRC